MQVGNSEQLTEASFSEVFASHGLCRRLLKPDKAALWGLVFAASDASVDEVADQFEASWKRSQR